MARWRLQLLGGFELSDGKTRLQRPGGRAVMLILARLALAPQRDHPREELIDLLWPEVDLQVGRNRLRQALSMLRSVLALAGQAGAPLLLADRHAVRLVPDAIECDVDALRAALRDGDPARVVALYPGELLPGYFDEWVLEERRHIGQAVEAVLGAKPLLASRRAVAPAMAPPSSPPRQQWLPTYLTRMVGYEEAGAALAASVRTHRLVLLRGPGGAGKTRLAVETARVLAGETMHAREPGAPFDGVVFVPLAGVADSTAVVESVLRALRSEALGGGAGRGAQEQLEQALAGRHMLLVLDNFEQLVEAARDMLARWLSRLPALHLLVTSRRALGLDGEHEQALAALTLPAIDAGRQEHAQNPAVALFVDRARAARGSFSLNERNHATVAAIVCLLQGLPLAIELAAARVRSIALAQMRAMLEAALHGQPDAAFALLSRAGPRAADDPRHASMQQVMAWSFQQLSPDSRALLDVLCVAADGATLDAAAAISGLPLHQVATRVDELVASSVVYTREGGDESTRYHPFEPVREYALMMLDASARQTLRERHWRWVAAWTEALGHAPSLAAFRDEEANLLAAWGLGARAGQAAPVLASALACARALDDVTLPPSALQLLQGCLAVLDRAGDDIELCARAHALLAEQCFESGQRDAASAHAERALELMPADSAFRADALQVAARIRLRVHNDTGTIGPLVDEGLALAERHGRLDLQARLLALQAVLVARRDRNRQRKIELDTAALAAWRAFGSPARVTEGLVNLGLALGFVHRVAEQLALLEQARDTAAVLGQHRLHAFSCSVIGFALADLERWDESAASYRMCLAAAWAHSAWREWFYALWNLPRTLAHQRAPEEAAQLMGFADRFGSERFGQLGWSDLRERRRTRRLVRAQLGAAREAVLWDQGRELGMADAMRLAVRFVAG